VQGFILFGGTASAAREAADALQAQAGQGVILGADLERGAGQQFRGATPLPPLAALAALEDLEVIRAAGALTGREAVALGIPWVFAPVADLAVEPDNPIVGTRAFGGEAGQVARQVSAWCEGCMSAGAIPCVKHFPGHGRTRTDSHAELPVVEASRATLEATDLLPFRAAVAAGVPSVMTAHVAYPALDPTGRAATRSAPLLQGLLRDRMGFGGVVVTDALIMKGAGDPASAAVEALAAGADLLLYPPDSLDLEAILRGGSEPGRLTAELRSRSRARVATLVAQGAVGRGGEHGAASWTGDAAEGGGGPRREWGRPEDRALARSWAMAAMKDRGWRGRLGSRLSLTLVDDDLGGPYPPPSREDFRATLRARGVEVTVEDPAAPGLLCIFAEPRAWKGRAGLSPESRSRVRRWHEAFPGAPAVVFGGPRILADLPPGLPALLAWGGEPLMQEAAALRLVEGKEAP
jgi:beta-glucosidase-like glycosyl hydrolase